MRHPIMLYTKRFYFPGSIRIQYSYRKMLHMKKKTQEGKKHLIKSISKHKKLFHKIYIYSKYTFTQIHMKWL